MKKSSVISILTVQENHQEKYLDIIRCPHLKYGHILLKVLKTFDFKSLNFFPGTFAEHFAKIAHKVAKSKYFVDI